MLHHLNATHATLKSESAQLADMRLKANDYTQTLDELRAKVERTDRANVKENAEKDDERQLFVARKHRIVNKMSGLIEKMNQAIKLTAVRKATPHPDAQKELNALNAKSQLYAEQIATLSTKIDCLKNELADAKKTEAELVSKKDKRAKLLALAKSTAAKLKHAVEVMTNVVKKKDSTVRIHQPSVQGVKFASSLADTMDQTLHDAIHQVKSEAHAHFRQNMTDHVDKMANDVNFLHEMEALPLVGT